MCVKIVETVCHSVKKKRHLYLNVYEKSPKLLLVFYQQRIDEYFDSNKNVKKQSFNLRKINELNAFFKENYVDFHSKELRFIKHKINNNNWRNIYFFAYLFNFGRLKKGLECWRFIYDSNSLRNCISNIFEWKRFFRLFSILIFQIFLEMSNNVVCKVWQNQEKKKKKKIARMRWLVYKYKNTHAKNL